MSTWQRYLWRSGVGIDIALLPVALAACVAAALVTLVMVLSPRADPAAPTVSPRTLDHRGLRGFVHRQAEARKLTAAAMGVALAAVIGGAAVAGVIFAMVRSRTGLASWDRAAAEFGARHAAAASTTVLRRITDLGSTVGVIVITLAVVAVGGRRSRTPIGLLFLVVVLVGEEVIVNTTKVVVARARPDIEQLVGTSSHSFPSGHAATAAAMWATLALLVGRGRSRPVRIVLAAAAAGIAAAVAASRVLLGVHWLTDVVAGLAVGWAWFAACSIAFGGRLVHFAAPVETPTLTAPER